MKDIDDEEDTREDLPPPVFLRAVSGGGEDPNGDVPMLDLTAARHERRGDDLRDRRRRLLFMVLDIMATMWRN
ncbi:hypothetical protein SCP_0604090 [Sparassis crispa]|uniref:Uncharacterized protein n=1 Tax=Sparassis crispa TaxID=139825 RepID=A0A401GQJ9_9APHY|nr:hypothetical protein SCP_0604090 [Sparassis crispa]GBE84430.1 hypothetical protein SCP_0604090 [Sparassis crispa]